MKEVSICIIVLAMGGVCKNGAIKISTVSFCCRAVELNTGNCLKYRPVVQTARGFVAR
jgi:hypothetical protein